MRFLGQFSLASAPFSDRFSSYLSDSSGPVRPSRAEDESAEDREHVLPAMQCGGEPDRDFLQTHHDWEGNFAKGEEEGESRMRRLWTGDGGGVP